MGGTRASAVAVASVVGGVLLMLLLVTWAASIGPSDVLRGQGPAPVRVTITPSESPEPDSAVTNDGERRLQQKPGPVSPVFRIIALVLETLAAGAGLVLLYRALRWLHQVHDARRRRDPTPEEVDFDTLDVPARLARELLDESKRQHALLLSGEPDEGIVAAWHRFEAAAAEIGVARRAWETSSEFTVRVLELVSADPKAIDTLGALYREARFSRHPMTDEQRHEAARALDRIHRGLGSRAVGSGT